MNIFSGLKEFVPQSILNWRSACRQKKDLRLWRKSDCEPLPPPHAYKQQVIAYYQSCFRYSLLIETGTFLGDMVEAQKNRFDSIVSIELSEMLHKKAKRRFRNQAHISILQGDSARVLPQVVQKITGPAIFWLDGHYSAGITAKGDRVSPIMEELNAILSGNNLNHILLIDDARCFCGEDGYPTYEEVVDCIRQFSPRSDIRVEMDIIRCVLNY